VQNLGLIKDVVILPVEHSKFNNLANSCIDYHYKFWYRLDWVDE